LASVFGRAGLCWLVSEPMDVQWTHICVPDYRGTSSGRAGPAVKGRRAWTAPAARCGAWRWITSWRGSGSRSVIHRGRWSPATPGGPHRWSDLRRRAHRRRESTHAHGQRPAAGRSVAESASRGAPWTGRSNPCWSAARARRPRRATPACWRLPARRAGSWNAHRLVYRGSSHKCRGAVSRHASAAIL